MAKNPQYPAEPATTAMTAEDLSRMPTIMPSEPVPERFQVVREEPEFVYRVERLTPGDVPPTTPSSKSV